MRAYFNINLYKSFFSLSQKLGDQKEEINKFLKNKEIEKVRRKHTLDLKEKIGAKSEQELNLSRLSTKKELDTNNESLKSNKNNINAEDYTKKIIQKNETISLEKESSNIQNNRTKTKLKLITN